MHIFPGEDVTVFLMFSDDVYCLLTFILPPEMKITTTTKEATAFLFTKEMTSQ